MGWTANGKKYFELIKEERGDSQGTAQPSQNLTKSMVAVSGDTKLLSYRSDSTTYNGLGGSGSLSNSTAPWNPMANKKDGCIGFTYGDSTSTTDSTLRRSSNYSYITMGFGSNGTAASLSDYTYTRIPTINSTSELSDVVAISQTYLSATGELLVILTNNTSTTYTIREVVLVLITDSNTTYAPTPEAGAYVLWRETVTATTLVAGSTATFKLKVYTDLT